MGDFALISAILPVGIVGNIDLIKIKAKKVPRFVPGKGLKDAV